MINDTKKLAAAALLGIMTASLIVLPVAGVPYDALGNKETSGVALNIWREPLTETQKAELLLDRITFGPRPGDVKRVEQTGLNHFLDQQLHPATVDDRAMQAKLQDLQTLQMSPSELIVEFPAPMQAKRHQMKGLAGLQGRGEAQAMQAPAGETANPANQTGDTRQSRAPGPQGPRTILLQLGEKELLRAVYSQRQLQEVMVRFWMNHFNIYWPKGADRYYLTSFEENVIRPHALGNFEDLLVTTAESPAMLFYLDNWMSVDPHQPGLSPPRFGPAMMSPGVLMRSEAARIERARKQRNRRGLNENYGRELMELHTIGLHYTQKDVTEVARCFTGWTIRRPRWGGGFYFNPRLHDYGSKVVLGHVIPAGQGMKDGVQVLHILAMSRYTANHLAYQLCQRFVADHPPAELVKEAAQTYLRTHGNIRSVLRTILTSPEFYSQGVWDAKVKSPFEYVASALRALGAESDGGRPLLGFLAQMGEPLFRYQAPSGYDDVATTWINSSALLARMNFAIALTLGRIPGTQVDWQKFFGPERDEAPREMLVDLSEALMDRSLSPSAESAILNRLTDGNTQQGRFTARRQMRMMAALIIASPEFQQR